MMWIVSALCRRGRSLFMMAWPAINLLYPVLEWLLGGLGLLWRCAARMLRPIVGYIWAIGWWQEPGGRDEAREEVRRSGESLQNEAEETVGGQPEERAAASDREQSGCEEDDEDELEKSPVETPNEFCCDYDSTWEDEERQEGTCQKTRRPAGSRNYKFSRFESAAKDMQNYRHDYPSRPQRWRKPASQDKPNLKFYLGLTPSIPDGVFIGDFHNQWFGEYDTLEYIHTYIQWLFPLQEQGVNYEASALTKEEIKDFLESDTAKENLLKSYKLMLDFYGIELCNEETGEVKRAAHWKERFKNLDSHTHNSLRITRILKCQGTLGYPHYQGPLVRFFLQETLVNGELPNIKDSVLNYFVFAVLDKTQRKSLIKFAYMNYDHKDEFVWCPKKIQMKWSRSVSSQDKGME